MSNVDLPVSWSAGILSDLCTLSSASALPTESGAPIYVGLEHVDSGAFSLTRWASPQAFKSNAFVFQSGDVLYGKLRPYLDKAVIAPSAGVCSTELLVLRPKPNIPSEFLLAILHTPEFIAYAQSSADKQYPRTSWNWISQYPCPRPPADEQRKIAAVLGKVQATVAVEGDLVRVARELKQTALRQLFTRGLRNEPTRESRYGTVPAAWGEAVLSECAYVQTGIAKNSKNHRPDDIEIPYLRVANVQDGRLDLREMKNIQVSAKDAEACLLQIGDVVLTEGGDFDKLGRGFIWEGQIERCVHQNHVFAVRTNRDRLDPRFFAYLAQSPYGKAYFLSVAHKTTNLACINTTKLRAFPLLLPSPAEQREIAAMLATLDAKIAHHEARQALLRELFRTLLHDLLTARRRVTSLD
jgi:type I restriction enzyme S subunit